MSVFTLAISCLTTSNLPWFMDLTFQVPMQYCSLQHWTFLLLPVPFTTGCCFCFGSIPLFFLELFLHWSPVVYWAPTHLGSFSFSILSFCLFILFMGFSRQEYWSGLPFPSPVDHVLSELSTMTCPSWVALHGMAHSFIELDKAVVRVIRLASFLWLWFQCVCPLMSSRNTYHLTWVSLTLDEGYLLLATPPDLEREISLLGCSPLQCRTAARFRSICWLKEMNHLKNEYNILLSRHIEEKQPLWCSEGLFWRGKGGAGIHRSFCNKNQVVEYQKIIVN